MSFIEITIEDVENGFIHYESNPPLIILSEKVANDSGATSTNGIAMFINRILSIAKKIKGKETLELFSKSKITFTIKDELNGQVKFTSNPNHKFLMQKELSGHSLTNAENIAVRIIRMLAVENKIERSKESIDLNGGWQ